MTTQKNNDSLVYAIMQIGVPAGMQPADAVAYYYGVKDMLDLSKEEFTKLYNEATPKEKSQEEILQELAK